jgi:hypothetical protein
MVTRWTQIWRFLASIACKIREHFSLIIVRSDRLKMTGLTSKIWILFFAACLCLGAARGASFTATLDRDTMTLGETATLSLAFEGGSPQSEPTPDVPGLEITSTGNTSSFSLVNGAMSSTVTLTYSITAQRTGQFTIPALTAQVGGQAFSTQPLILTVLKPDAPTPDAIHSGSESAYMTLALPPGKVYVGQELMAQLRIFIRDDVENFANFQFTAQNADGFILGKSAQGGRSRTRVGDRIYTVIPVTYALTATKTGQLTLGPFTATAVIVVPTQNQQGGDPFIRQFFNQGEQKQISLATDSANVEGLPLPDQGKPSNFGGAIGNFNLIMTVGPTNVTVGDPVTVRVQIGGHGALDSITLPDQSSLPGFKIFPPTVKTEPGNALGLDGTKTFEEIVTPQSADIHEWPQFSFSYFNPDDGQYHTLTQPAVPLTVHAAGSTPMPAFTKTSTPENQSPADILPIKENPGTLRSQPAPLISQPAFLALQGLPVLALLAALIWRRRMDNLANNPRLRRQLAVAQIISHGLVELKQFAAGNKPDEFFATLFRLLQEQLGERLDCPASAITENVIEEQPLLRNAPAATRDALRELFQLCNQARYAPVRGTSELNSVADQFQKVVGELRQLQA